MQTLHQGYEICAQFVHRDRFNYQACLIRHARFLLIFIHLRKEGILAACLKAFAVDVMNRSYYLFQRPRLARVPSRRSHGDSFATSDEHCTQAQKL
jgi:hypothetical protein